MADIDETLRNAGWFEVAPGAGVWRAPDDADNPSGRKYTTADAALRAVEALAATPAPKPRGRPRKTADT